MTENIILWRNALLPVNATLQQAIRNLDETGLQISMVISSEGELVGTLTDGDVRRGLLRGLSLESPIDSIIHHEPLVAPPQLGNDMVLQLMKVNKVRQLPIVDADQDAITSGRLC